MISTRKLLSCALFLAVSLAIDAQVIKIGSIAPDRSPWNDGIKELGREWERITQGTVKLKIYPGGIAGSEEDMVRKIRLGTLGGGLMTNFGLTKIDPDAFIFNTPFLFSSENELRYVMDRMKGELESQIEAKGFKVVIWSMSGWINFFSKDPVLYPEDMKRHKLSFTTGEPQLEQAWKKSGYVIVPTDLKDLMMSLQSGMANAFYLPPLLAAAGQYFPMTPHMNALRLAPLIGGIVISRRIWDQIPAGYAAQMIAVTRKITDRIDRETVALEKEAIDTMRKNGLIVHEPPPDSLKKWREASDKGMGELIGKAFSEEVYNRMIRLLKEYRQKNGE
jgi:TRAP-type C4-dicarboxylate transport system substrate-binding protein